MSESTLVEKPSVEYAESLGWKCRKLDVGPGGRSWPDHLMLGPKAQILIIEFKIEGGTLSPKQKKRKEQLERLGHKVHVIYTFEDFKDLLHNCPTYVQQLNKNR